MKAPPREKHEKLMGLMGLKIHAQTTTPSPFEVTPITKVAVEGSDAEKILESRDFRKILDFKGIEWWMGVTKLRHPAWDRRRGDTGANS